MKYLLALVATSLLSFSAHAIDYSKFTGKYKSTYEHSTFYAEFWQSEFGLNVTLVRGWNYKIQGKTYPFDCTENKCVSAFSEIGLVVELTLLESGNIIFRGSNDNGYLFTPDEGGAPEPGGDTGWKVTEAVDSQGVLNVTAEVANAERGASFVVKCKAPSADLSMALKVDKVLWRALSYSVENKQEKLSATLMAKRNTEHQINQWTLDQEGNALIRIGNITDAEVSDLKGGSVATIKLKTTATDGTSTEFSTLKFSLKGSSKALQQMKAKCTGTANTLF